MIDAIVFLGIQGSGKGTQAKILAARTGFQHVNIGDLLREQISLGTEIGNQVKSIISRGELVSDDLVFQMIESSLSSDCPGIIFDGFPRNISQAEHLVKHYRIARVYYLDLKEQEAIARIEGRRVCSKCGTNYHIHNQPPRKKGVCDQCGGILITRADDAPKAIAKRVKAFYDETFRLKDFFLQKGVLKSVSARLSISEIENIIYSDIYHG